MASTFAVTGFAAADIHPQGDDSLDAGVRAFWEVDPKRGEEGHAARWGGLGFEYKRLLGILSPQGLGSPAKYPMQYALTIPLHATFYPGDDYAHVQFSLGATYLTDYPAGGRRDTESTASGVATQERIGARVLDIRANWRHDTDPLMAGIFLTADWDLLYRDPGASSFEVFSQADATDDRWRVSLGIELGLYAGKSQ